MCSGPRQPDRHTQLVKTQTLISRDSPQLFRRFAIKGGFRINEDVKQPRLILFVDRVERKLHAIGEKFFKMRFDGIFYATNTTDGFSVARGFYWQTRRTVTTDNSLKLNTLNL